MRDEATGCSNSVCHSIARLLGVLATNAVMGPSAGEPCFQGRNCGMRTDAITHIGRHSTVQRGPVKYNRTLNHHNIHKHKHQTLPGYAVHGSHVALRATERMHHGPADERSDLSGRAWGGACGVAAMGSLTSYRNSC